MKRRKGPGVGNGVDNGRSVGNGVDRGRVDLIDDDRVILVHVCAQATGTLQHLQSEREPTMAITIATRGCQPRSYLEFH